LSFIFNNLLGCSLIHFIFSNLLGAISIFGILLCRVIVQPHGGIGVTSEGVAALRGAFIAYLAYT
jgi:hypothetical protein